MTISTGQNETTTTNPVRETDALTCCNDLDPARLDRVKKAYTTRFLADRLDADPRGYVLLSGPGVVPRAGDVVLARIDKLGMHTRLESPAGRRQTLFAGDEVLVAYADRYAPDQFEAEVPGDLRPAHLIAGGGLTGFVTAKHDLVKDATTVRPVGLLADVHGVVTLERLAPRKLRTAPSSAPVPPVRPIVVGVLGTSMNSGKSTAVSCLIRGLTRAGLRVSAGKATGTGAGGDPHGFVDAGATAVADFTDFGFGSTFRLEPDQVRSVLVSLVEELSVPEPDVIVVEIADGLYQRETRRLLGDPVLSRVVDQVVFASSSSVAATAGVALLRRHGLRVSAVSGVLTSAPLAAREAREVLDVPVIDTFELADPETARTVL